MLTDWILTLFIPANNLTFNKLNWLLNFVKNQSISFYPVHMQLEVTSVLSVVRIVPLGSKLNTSLPLTSHKSYIKSQNVHPSVCLSVTIFNGSPQRPRNFTDTFRQFTLDISSYIKSQNVHPSVRHNFQLINPAAEELCRHSKTAHTGWIS